jgi:hypothetical protein
MSPTSITNSSQCQPQQTLAISAKGYPTTSTVLVWLNASEGLLQLTGSVLHVRLASIGMARIACCYVRVDRSGIAPVIRASVRGDWCGTAILAFHVRQGRSGVML